jgi:hypothetical protein
MRKTYSFHITDNDGKWKIEYESKKNASRIKLKMIKALWKEDGLTVNGIRDKIANKSLNAYFLDISRSIEIFAITTIIYRGVMR